MGEQGGYGGQAGWQQEKERWEHVGEVTFTDSWEIVKGNLILFLKSRPQNSFEKCRAFI